MALEAIALREVPPQPFSMSNSSAASRILSRVSAEADLDDSGVGILISIKRLFELCGFVQIFATRGVIKIADLVDADVSSRLRVFLQFGRSAIFKFASIEATARKLFLRLSICDAGLEIASRFAT